MNSQARMHFDGQLPMAHQRAHPNLQNIGFLPSIHSAAVLNDSKLRAGSFISIPQLSATHPSNIYKMHLKAQAQLQTQQIDSAIHLLKMQYDAIISSIQSSSSVCADVGVQSQECDTTTPAVQDQASFAAQFALPCAESENKTAVGNKRGLHGLIARDSAPTVPVVKAITSTPSSSKTAVQDPSFPTKRARLQ